MTGRDGQPRFDLEERTFQFAKRVRQFVSKLPRSICNFVDSKQLVRSSGSVGANYLEANGSLSKKDFRYRLRISRKEAKESHYWLRLIDTGPDQTLSLERDHLIQETRELILIFNATLKKTEDRS